MLVAAPPQKYDPALVYGVKKPINPKPAAEKYVYYSYYKIYIRCIV